MRNRFICIILAALFAAVGVGCSSGDVAVSFDAENPWYTYEKSTYKIERYYVGGGARKLVAQGSYVTELRASDNTTTVSNKFSLSYNDEPECSTVNEYGLTMDNRGATDSYEATVEFDNNSLSPVTAKKNTSASYNAANNYGVEQRRLGDYDMPAFTANEDGSYSYALSSEPKYADPRGYSYDADYKNNKAVYRSTTRDTNGNTVTYKPVEKEFSMSGGTRFDNEQLAYVVRAMQATAKEGSGTFYLVSLQDCYARNEFIRYTMSLSCEKESTTFAAPLPEGLHFTNIENQEVAFAPNEDGNGGTYSVPCVSASVSISSETSGPPVKFTVTDPNIKLAIEGSENHYTRKLVLQMVYTEYSVTSVALAYETVYTLIGYDNVYRSASQQ